MLANDSDQSNRGQRLVGVGIISCLAAMLIAGYHATFAGTALSPLVDPALWAAPEYRLDPRDFLTWYSEEHDAEGVLVSEDDEYHPSYEADKAGLLPLIVLIFVEGTHAFATILLRASEVRRMGERARVVTVGGMLVVGVGAFALYALSVDVFFGVLTVLIVLHHIGQASSVVRAGAADPTDPTGARLARGDVALLRVGMLAPVALWFSESERGLDWFHFDTPHIVPLPAPLAPIFVLAWVSVLVIAVVRVMSALRAGEEAAVPSRVFVLIQVLAWGIGLHIFNTVHASDLSSMLLVVPHAVTSLWFTVMSARDANSSGTTMLLVLAAVVLSVMEHTLVVELRSPSESWTRCFVFYSLPHVLHILTDPLGRSTSG